MLLKYILLKNMFPLFSFGARTENPERLQCPHTLNQARMLQFLDRTQVKRRKNQVKRKKESSQKERSSEEKAVQKGEVS